jgi:glutaconate CoA-transferase subunit B
MSFRQEELLIDVLAGLLAGVGHVTVGALSPIPGAAALLAQARAAQGPSEARMQVSILGSAQHNPFTDGGVELFDCAAQGRIDACFLSGGQIDGHANLNLNGVGGHPRSKVRWSGAFGSAFLYFLVPRVILFREEHTPRVLVPEVEFVTAPGTSPPEVYRPGGPVALVTSRALFDFDRAHGRFALRSVHPGQSVEEVVAATGFDFDRPDQVKETPPPSDATLDLIRGPIGQAIALTYPKFAASRLQITPISDPAAAPAG